MDGNTQRFSTTTIPVGLNSPHANNSFASWLAEKLTNHASRAVVYQRDEVTVELFAVARSIGLARLSQSARERLEEAISLAAE